MDEKVFDWYVSLPEYTSRNLAVSNAAILAVGHNTKLSSTLFLPGNTNVNTIPKEKKYVDIPDVESAWSVIRKMQIRGTLERIRYEKAKIASTRENCSVVVA